jgi:hypothetical protein
MVYFEQPNVFYKGEMMMYYYCKNIINNAETEESEESEKEEEENVKFFSTIFYLNSGLDKKQRIFPLIKVKAFDENFDGLINKYDFRIAFNNDINDIIKNIKIILFFQYSLKENVNGSMVTPAAIDIDTPNGAGYIKINGDLNLYQKAPLTKNTFEQYDYSNVFGSNYIEQKEYDEILKEFSERNVSTIFEYDRFVSPLRSMSTVQIDVTVNIPSFQKILYATPQLTKFKFFWVQLMAIFIPCYIIFDIILVFLFKNKIFPCSITSDLPKIKNL